jgi:hypothetical protein
MQNLSTSSVPLFVTSVCFGSKLNDRVQWDVNVRSINLGEVVKVGVSGWKDDRVISAVTSSEKNLGLQASQNSLP